MLVSGFRSSKSDEQILKLHFVNVHVSIRMKPPQTDEEEL